MGGDLGQVRDDQHLVVPRERPQAPPDRIRGAAADPRVDLVEHERRRVVRRGEDLLDRQRDAAQLPARRDLRQRARRLARVRGEPEDDLVGAGRIERDGVAVRAPRPPRPAPAGRRPTSTANAPARKPRTAQRLVRGDAQALGGRAAPLRQHARGLGDARGAAARRRPRAGGARRPGPPGARSPPPRARAWAMTAASSSPYRRSSE